MKNAPLSFLFVLSCAGFFFLQGCAIVPILPVIASGIGGAATYSILNTAHKTETYPAKEVLRGSIKALNNMGFVIKRAERSTVGWGIAAETQKRKITIELESITPKATKVTVNVMEGSILKDKATAEAIISELDILLEEREKKIAHKTALLFIKTTPVEAVINFTSIPAKFYQGIELQPGSYILEVSAEDHETQAMEVCLKPYEERFLEIPLKCQKFVNEIE